MSARCGDRHPEERERTCTLLAGAHGHHADAAGPWPNTEVLEQHDTKVRHRAGQKGTKSQFRQMVGEAIKGRREILAEQAAQQQAALGAPHVALPADPTDTQQQAAARVLPKTGTQRRRVYDALVVAGLNGLTDEEIQTLLEMNPSSVRPRRGELVEQGLVEDSGRRRSNTGDMMIVWRVT